ncbi:glycosyltransferase [Olleya sp. YS]|uniref:glycosyltransferase n=1 Tax=Olleya sp. YS TaxID=3028318 RepID=UPI0024340DBC|nr:glycosyltransferase [Olleya sp. YS]WGD35534.1 glycosyltransferase [Olleya sp. YS]
MKKRILVAPLNWGIGHATRCIPIINGLLDEGFDPIIASDGEALQLLKKEFKDLIFVELPSYNIRYSKTKSAFKWLLFLQLPKIRKAINREHKLVRKIIHDYAIEGIISDNRLGVYSSKVPSVFTTHQLTVLSGNTTKFSTFLHTCYIKKFNECWVPDFEGEPNLSGKLSHNFKSKELTIKYIGALSRLKKTETKPKNRFMVLLSGPEPQRSILEERLLDELKVLPGLIIFVRGKIEVEQVIVNQPPFAIYNFMEAEELQKHINNSDIIISRSGYTTIMDLAKLGKQAFFIPTPGQFEQEYLAKYLEKSKIAPYCEQDDFSLSQLNKSVNYSGFKSFENEIDFKQLFSLF